MESIDVAVRKVKDGEALYRELAQRTHNHGLQVILMLLVEEERKHRRTLENLSHTVMAPSPHAVITEAKNIFSEMRQSGAEIPDESGQADLYRQGLALKTASREFFEALDEECEGLEADVFRAIAKAEAKQFELLENLLQFVLSPKAWLAEGAFERMSD